MLKNTSLPWQGSKDGKSRSEISFQDGPCPRGRLAISGYKVEGQILYRYLPPIWSALFTLPIQPICQCPRIDSPEQLRTALAYTLPG